MRKYIPLLCLVLCAGLFCFMFFGDAEQKARRNNFDERGANPASGENYENAEKADDSPENQGDLSSFRPAEGELTGSGAENGGEIAPAEGENQNDTAKGSGSGTTQNDEKKNSRSVSDKKESINLSIGIPDEAASYQGDLRSMAEDVLSTLKITQGGFEYHHPQVKDGLHLGVKLQVFAENGEGDETLYRYLSDAGWMSGNDYDASEHSVIEKWDLPKDISKTKIILELKAFDLRSGVIDVFDVIWENGKCEILSMETKS